VVDIAEIWSLANQTTIENYSGNRGEQREKKKINK